MLKVLFSYSKLSGRWREQQINGFRLVAVILVVSYRPNRFVWDVCAYRWASESTINILWSPYLVSAVHLFAFAKIIIWLNLADCRLTLQALSSIPFLDIIHNSIGKILITRCLSLTKVFYRSQHICLHTFNILNSFLNNYSFWESFLCSFCMYCFSGSIL